MKLGQDARFIWGDVWFAGRYARATASERFRFEWIVQEMVVRRGGTATKVKKAGVDADKRTLVRSEDRVGIFGRLLRFFREVVAELRKVIWPTRKELVTYTVVCLTFVVFMVIVVTSLDYGFTKLVFAVFG